MRNLTLALLFVTQGNFQSAVDKHRALYDVFEGIHKSDPNRSVFNQNEFKDYLHSLNMHLTKTEWGHLWRTVRLNNKKKKVLLAP